MIGPTRFLDNFKEDGVDVAEETSPINWVKRDKEDCKVDKVEIEPERAQVRFNRA